MSPVAAVAAGVEHHGVEGRDNGGVLVRGGGAIARNFPRIFKYLKIRYLENEAFLDISLFLKKWYFLGFYTNCQSLYHELREHPV